MIWITSCVCSSRILETAGYTQSNNLTILTLLTCSLHHFSRILWPHRWCNAEKDILLCSSCNSALAILLNNSLSAAALKRITSTYRQQLATGHGRNCPFRLDAEQALLREGSVGAQDVSAHGRSTDQKVNMVVPIFLASVLPSDAMELMEQQLPRSLLRARIDRFEEALNHAVERFKLQITPSKQRRRDSRAWQYPALKYIPEFKAFRPAVLASNEDNSDDMLSQAADCIGNGNATTTALSLLGWNPLRIEHGETFGDNSCPVVRVTCSLCLAQRDLKLVKKSVVEFCSDSSDDELGSGANISSSPAVKRRIRQFNKAPDPVTAHRRYCPWVCGFPTEYLSPDRPIWQTIVTRLFDEMQKNTLPADAVTEDDTGSEAGNGEKEFEETLQLLNSGIASPEISGKMNDNKKRFAKVMEEISRPAKRPRIPALPEPVAVPRHVIEELRRTVTLKEMEQKRDMGREAIEEKESEDYDEPIEIEMDDVAELDTFPAALQRETKELDTFPAEHRGETIHDSRIEATTSPGVEVIGNFAEEEVIETEELKEAEKPSEEHERTSLLDLNESDPVEYLPGMAPSSATTLSALGLPTIGLLGSYKFFLLARAMATMAETESQGGRLEGSVMNVDHAVTKEWETRSLAEICNAPIEALEGIGKQGGSLWNSLNVRTIKDLVLFKPCQLAEAICNASKHMHKTSEVRESKSDEKLLQSSTGDASQDGVDTGIPTLGSLKKYDPVDNLPGIDPISASTLSALGLSSIEALASYKFFLLARAMTTMAETETVGGRLSGSLMNIDHAVTKDWEAKHLSEMCEAPIEAFEGIGTKAGALWESLNVVTIRDLAMFKFCIIAEALCGVSENP